MLAGQLGWAAPSVFVTINKVGEVRGVWQGKLSTDDIASMLWKTVELESE